MGMILKRLSESRNHFDMAKVGGSHLPGSTVIHFKTGYLERKPTVQSEQINTICAAQVRERRQVTLICLSHSLYAQ
jgi:hypothetical protein